MNPAHAILLLKADQPGLFDTPTYVEGHTRKDGAYVHPHMATRKKHAVTAPGPQAAPKLEAFIAKHGGAERLRATLDGLTGEQSAKLVDAMAQLDGQSAAAVLHRLGSSAAFAHAVPTPTPVPAAEATAPESQADPDFAAAEDRHDLAEAAARDPHSDETRMLAARVAAHDAPAETFGAGDMDPSSPNYRYRDTGYVGGSRKEEAILAIRRAARRGQRVRASDVDWDEVEANPREAQELITKANLFGAVDWSALRDAGVDPSAGFLISKVYGAVATTPAEDTPVGRRDYALAIDTLRDRMEHAHSAEDVTGLLEDIRQEREGSMMNEREGALFQGLLTLSRAASARVRDLEEQADALHKRSMAMGETWKLKREVEQRKGRGWAPKPELEQQIAEMERGQAEARDAYIAFRKLHRMDPIVHREATPNGVSSRFEYPHKAELSEIHDRIALLRGAVKLRNAEENPLTRAWASLGGSFQAVLDHRTHKGSDAFARHVATSKSGRVSDWFWAETKREPKGASGRSTAFQLLVADSFSREGGRDPEVASTADLKTRFNLREVQSGNWVLDDPNSAKFHVEATAGALADLADLLNLRDSDVSFNGRLAIAFGARGKGGFNSSRAHYEPVQRVINITKLAGGGTLAHEWWHTVDNLVREAAGGEIAGVDDFATEIGVEHPDLGPAFKELTDAMMSGPHRRTEEVSYTETEEAWARMNVTSGLSGIAREIKAAPSVQGAVDVVEAAFRRGAFGPPDKKRAQNRLKDWRKIALIHKGGNADRIVRYETGPGMSAFMLDSLDLDKGVSGKYWSQPREMAARAFQSYVEDKLSGAGRVSSYLVDKSNNAAYVHMNARPFPDQGERSRTSAAFDRVFAAMRKDDTLAKAAGLVDVVI